MRQAGARYLFVLYKFNKREAYTIAHAIPIVVTLSRGEMAVLMWIFYRSAVYHSREFHTPLVIGVYMN